MKARDLIALLQTLPPDHDVILSKDAEGNGYSPLASVAEAHYRPATTWRGEEHHPDDEDCGPDNAVVFWPVC